MNKKQNLLAIAISASFILGGANVAQASENLTPIVEEENVGSQIDNNVVENNPAETTPQKTEKDEEGKDAGKEEAVSYSTAQNNDETTADSTNRSAHINDNAKAEPASLQIGEERTPAAQGAGETEAKKDIHIQKADDPNYGKDEAKIQDYNASNRYKETDLQPGDTNQSLVKTDEKVEKDGFKFEIKNPS